MIMHGGRDGVGTGGGRGAADVGLSAVQARAVPGNGWWMAQRRLDLVRGTPFEVVCRTLMASLEAGWQIVAPLEGGGCFAPREPEGPVGDLLAFAPERVSRWLGWYAEMYVVDPYRDLLHCCAAYVRGSADRTTPDLMELQSEAEHLVRAYQVLLLAAADPRVPEETRARIAEAGALGAWYDGFVVAFEPFTEMIDRLDREPGWPA